ncbi:Uu.00g106680.m01.CDS01 [Anthostomella pinea]|uniref:Uu.00g106680.m01.CDS01 n=1 Tax=Anthostomella pinea TaxID=933095 RepID=A0AAI8VEP2_9PEZI|nr:Uu.00g106680.m01.CDS01 [Anthostomella pinea]
MDTSNLVAAWLSFAATAVGLGGLITQASAINDRLDPFHANRTAEYLGVWFRRQQRFPWWRIARPPPLGPVITAKLSDGFCGVNHIHITRIPLAAAGKAGWSLILAMFNSEAPVRPGPADGDQAEKAVVLETSSGSGDVDGGRESRASNSSDSSGSSVPVCAMWDFLPRKALTRHNRSACVMISRTTLITMLVMTNARPVFQYSDATGVRAGYASYCGQWYITWPIGEEAIIKFAAHDSIGTSEVLPRSFVQRVDRCGQMISGMICAPASDLKVAFCGRKPPGVYRLEHLVKGFQGAHGSRHLYNMMGGKAYDVDFMFARPSSSEAISDHEDGVVVLELLSSTDMKKSMAGSMKMVVPAPEQAVLRHALDCLPWTSLSWSMHRGMRDVLLAYAKPVMDAHRSQLAAQLRRTVAERADALRAWGWDAQFVRDNMAHMAASAVLAGSGNSGDSVRVVTDIVAVMIGDWDFAQLDEVCFWRRSAAEEGEGGTEAQQGELDAQAVVALTKVFVLEWSQEFDYQMYHGLPISMYFG